jgi:hypothetical protein
VFEGSVKPPIAPLYLCAAPVSPPKKLCDPLPHDRVAEHMFHACCQLRHGPRLRWPFIVPYALTPAVHCPIRVLRFIVLHACLRLSTAYVLHRCICDYSPRTIFLRMNGVPVGRTPIACLAVENSQSEPSRPTGTKRADLNIRNKTGCGACQREVRVALREGCPVESCTPGKIKAVLARTLPSRDAFN